MSKRKTISENDLVDLNGKVVIVTGANTGIGYATVQLLARKGAKVYIAARNEGRVTNAIKELQKEGIKDGSVHWLKLDLSDPRLAKQAANDFLAKEERLDILVNNAALSAGPHHLNKDGLLDIMTINHISNFAFTDALLPLLKKTSTEEGSDVRVVNVSSQAHERKAIKTFGKETLTKNYGDSFSGTMDNYAVSKLANVLHMKELQRRLNDEDVHITCIALHPGAIKTKGSTTFVATVPFIGPFASKFLTPLFLDQWKVGGMTPAFAAAGMDVRDNKKAYEGVYLIPYGQISKPSESALDPRLAKELYETTEQVLQELK